MILSFNFLPTDEFKSMLQEIKKENGSLRIELEVIIAIHFNLIFLFLEIQFYQRVSSSRFRKINWEIKLGEE